MEQNVLVNFRLNANDKRKMEEVCNEIGISMSSAFAIFAKKVAREKRIPFELNVDPFYSEENFKRLSKAISDAKNGKNMSEHELIEVE